MLKLGYKASAEQFAPSKLLDFAVMAEQVGLGRSPADQEELERMSQAGSASLGEAAWSAALGAGRDLSLDAAAELISSQSVKVEFRILSPQ